MANLITARTGKEQHSSTWGKFVILGLPLVAEDKSYDRHTFYVDSAAEAEDGTMFTIWQSSGDKYGTTDADFYICKAGGSPTRIEGGHRRGDAFIEGEFGIVAHGKGNTKATRLLSWWTTWAPKNGGQTHENAELMGEQIDIRGRAWPVVKP